jgi:hypothetical protein
VYSAQVSQGFRIKAEVITDDFYDVDGRAIVLPPSYSGIPKIKKFRDSDLTTGNLLIWEPGVNQQIENVLILDQNGEAWNVPYSLLTNSTVSVSFEFIRPIPGEWTVIVG